MLERVYAYIQRHGMFTLGCRVGVAVSGGADSICLLHILRELAPRWNLHLEVLHLDHGLRGAESAADAAFVEHVAADFSLPFHLLKSGPLEGNLEQAGREARRKFFRSCLDSGQLDRIALGHTRNDQAETLLFRLLRGTGPAGLGAIRPVTADGFVRPLLDTTRAEIEQFLRTRAFSWREDATNRDICFARNRIRHELLPQLAAGWNPQILDALSQTAQLMQDDAAYWEREIDRVAGQFLRREPGAVILDGSALRNAPAAVSRRVIRRAAELIRGDLKALGYEHIEAILQLATREEGDGRLQVPGLDILRSFDQIRVARPVANGLAGRNWRVPLELPGSIPLPDGKWLLSLQFAETGYTEEGDLDRSRLAAPLDVRNWRPGDQYQRRGRFHAEKLKTLFQEFRIPLWERRNWPIVTMADEIVWARRFGPASKFAAGQDCREILRISVREVSAESDSAL